VSDWRAKVAAVAAVCVFGVLVFFFRMRTWMPFALAAFTFAAVWLALPPRRRERQIEADDDPALSEGTEEEQAVAQLDGAAEQLRRLAHRAPGADKPLFEHLAELMARLSGHHRANPEHAERTRLFRRHMVGRMISSVSDYIDLAHRAGTGQADRLAAISKQLEDYVPALERIDRACLDNDMTALEISIDVLNEQLDRKR